MLVHRDNDDQSGGKEAGKDPAGTIGKPHLVSNLSGSADRQAGEFGEADNGINDDGKSHLIGDALKSVYQRTLEEEIPDDFLDLLKQLK